MSDEPQTDDSAVDAEWAIAVATDKPFLITASNLDSLLSIIFINETAIFQLSQAISKLQVGDLDASKQSNMAAVETAKKAFESSKTLARRFKLQLINAKHDEDLTHGS